jgi:hypothetical protein
MRLRQIRKLMKEERKMRKMRNIIFSKEQESKLSEVIEELRKTGEILYTTDILQMADIEVTKPNQQSCRYMLQKAGVPVHGRGGNFNHRRKMHRRVIEMTQPQGNGDKPQVESNPVTRFQSAFDSLTLLKELHVLINIAERAIYMDKSNQSLREQVKRLEVSLSECQKARSYLRADNDRLTKTVQSLNDLERQIKG